MTESFTEMSVSSTSPVLRTRNFTFIASFAATSTPGATSEVAESLMTLSTAIDGAATTWAWAVSMPVTGVDGLPSASAGGLALTVPTLEWASPALSAGMVAVQVIDLPAAREVAGQVMSVMTSSVTFTSLRSTVPVLNTSNVTLSASPALTAMPGRTLASSPLIFFTSVTDGVPAGGGVKA